MKIHSQSFDDNAAISPVYAFCKKDPDSHVALSDNESPHIAWSELPEGTASLALLCHDPDVPSVGDRVNKEGLTVPADLPRVDFFHWVLVDIDPKLGALEAGAFSSGVTARGKDGPKGPLGTRAGINDYTGWFAGDADMAGDYFGYDGPCPPWNDERLHHYVFTLYALDVAKAPVQGRFDGHAVRRAIEGHVLGQASWTGTYTLNPDVG